MSKRKKRINPNDFVSLDKFLRSKKERRISPINLITSKLESEKQRIINEKFSNPDNNEVKKEKKRKSKRQKKKDTDEENKMIITERDELKEDLIDNILKDMEKPDLDFDKKSEHY